MTQPSESFDVIIIGGGPAGAAAAITLSSRGFLTAIIECSDYSMIRIGETLPPSISRLLIDLGIWNSFLEINPIESFAIRSVWGSHEFHDSIHIYNPYGSGWHINRTRFDEMLVKGAINAGATVINKTRIINLSYDHNSKWRVVIQHHKCLRYLHTPILIDATGRAAAIIVNLPRSFHVIDRLIGVVRFFNRVTEPYTLIEAEAHGWWYSAPLPRDRIVVAYMTDADILADSSLNPNDYWTYNLSNAPLTYERLGPQTPLDSKIVSAASMIRRPLCGTDWLAVGDACMAIDPLSGQGVYNALKGGILAGESVIARLNGSKETFTDYLEWINNRFSIYLQMRSFFYSKEQRWPNSPFWNRRHNSIRTSYT